MTTVTHIAVSAGGGAAIIFCLYLLAAYAPTAVALPIALAFMLVNVVVGKIIDAITGKNGFHGSVVMLVPEMHESGLLPTILVIWLILSVLIFGLIWIWQKYLYL